MVHTLHNNNEPTKAVVAVLTRDADAGVARQLGPWSTIAVEALEAEIGTYLPEFSAALVSDTARLVCLGLREPLRQACSPTRRLPRPQPRRSKSAGTLYEANVNDRCCNPQDKVTML